jgi:hypothetical protein
VTVKQTYRVVSGVIALCVLVQAAAIAFGWAGGAPGLRRVTEPYRVGGEAADEAE